MEIVTNHLVITPKPNQPLQNFSNRDQSVVGSLQTLALIQNTAQEMLLRWLNWVEAASVLPLEEQEKLAKRDLEMRKISAERDPGNMTAAKIFGVDFANQLVQALWQSELAQSEA